MKIEKKTVALWIIIGVLLIATLFITFKVQSITTNTQISGSSTSSGNVADAMNSMHSGISQTQVGGASQVGGC